MTDVFNQLNLPLPADISPTETAEQWAERHTGHSLSPSETVNADGLRMAARKFRRQKLMEVLVSKA